MTTASPIHGTEIVAATATTSGPPATATAAQTASGCQVGTSSRSTSAVANSTGSVVSGSVPPPPLGQQIAAGLMTIEPSAPGAASTRGGASPAVPVLALLGQPSVRLYESSCSAAELVAYYTQTLTGEGWAGSFVMPSASPFSSFSMTTTNTSISASGAVSGPLARPLAGTFVGATNDGLVVALIETQPIQATSGATTSRGPTYVQIVLQRIPYVGASPGS